MFDDFNLNIRLKKFEKLSTLFVWKNSKSTNFLKRLQKNFEIYYNYIQQLKINYNNFINYVNNIVFSTSIEKFEKFKNFIFAIKIKNERFVEHNNKINDVNMKFTNFLIIIQVQVAVNSQQSIEKIKFQRSAKTSNSLMFFEKNKIFIRSFLFVIRIKIKINANYFVKNTFKNIQLNIIEYIYFKFEKIVVAKTLSLILSKRFITIIEFFKYIARIFENLDLIFIA